MYEAKLSVTPFLMADPDVDTRGKARRNNLHNSEYLPSASELAGR